MAKRRESHTVTLELGAKGNTRKLKLYTSRRIVTAVRELLEPMNIYQFARLTQVLGAVHEAGKKAGARQVFEAMEVLKNQIPHRRPERPSN